MYKRQNDITRKTSVLRRAATVRGASAANPVKESILEQIGRFFTYTFPHGTSTQQLAVAGEYAAAYAGTVAALRAASAGLDTTTADGTHTIPTNTAAVTSPPAMLLGVTATAAVTNAAAVPGGADETTAHTMTAAESAAFKAGYHNALMLLAKKDSTCMDELFTLVEAQDGQFSLPLTTAAAGPVAAAAPAITCPPDVLATLLTTVNSLVIRMGVAERGVVDLRGLHEEEVDQVSALRRQVNRIEKVVAAMEVEMGERNPKVPVAGSTYAALFVDLQSSVFALRKYIDKNVNEMGMAMATTINTINKACERSAAGPPTTPSRRGRVLNIPGLINYVGPEKP